MGETGTATKTYLVKVLIYSVPASKKTGAVTDDLYRWAVTSLDKQTVASVFFDEEMKLLEARRRVKVESRVRAVLRPDETLTVWTGAFGDYPLAKGVDPKKITERLGSIATPYILYDGKVVIEILKEAEEGKSLTLSLEGNIAISLDRKNLDVCFSLKDLAYLTPGETILYSLGPSKDGKRKFFMAFGLSLAR